MKKVLWSLFFSTLAYIFVLSLGHSYYLTKINQQMENTIGELVRQISEIQTQQAWDDLNKEKK